MKYRLSNRQPETGSIIVLTLEPKGSKGLQFEPGQYAALRFKRHGRPTPARCLSVIRSDTSGLIQFGVRIDGKFTSALNELPVGSEIEIDGPFGEFVYETPFDQTSVMLAGGIGITPILSILRTSVRSNPSNSFTLLYSNHSEDDIPFADELLKLEQQFQNFRVVFVISKARAATFDRQHLIEGRITPKLIEQAARGNFSSTSFFVCGPTTFMDDITDELRSRGTHELRINSESFTTARGARVKSGFAVVGQRLISVYSLATLAFIGILAAIITSDLSAHSVATAQTKTNTPATTDTSSSATSQTAPIDTTPTTTTTTTDATPTQVYQQPMSSVS